MIENQYLTSLMPERTSIRSNSGTSWKNCLDLGLAGEAHHPLDAGAVVPGAVEQHDLAAGRQMRDVALEVPLRPLALGRRRQGDDAADARVEALGDALDGAALARRVAALEQHDQLVAGVLHPVLQLDQLRLQPEQLVEIDPAVDRRFVLQVGDVAELAGDPQVVDLHLQLLVEAVLELGVDPGSAAVCAVRFGHAGSRAVPQEKSLSVRPVQAKAGS